MCVSSFMENCGSITIGSSRHSWTWRYTTIGESNYLLYIPIERNFACDGPKYLLNFIERRFVSFSDMEAKKDFHINESCFLNDLDFNADISEECKIFSARFCTNFAFYLTHADACNIASHLEYFRNSENTK